MKLQYFPQNESILRQKSASIKNVDGDLNKKIKSMLKLMYEKKGVGLAAIQVGIKQRFFVMDISTENNQPLVFINPVIVAQEGEIEWEEGCLSIPDITYPTKRAAHVIVEGIDEKGNAFKRELTELASVCVQHEIDHLNGKLFIDQLSRLKYNRLKAKLLKEGKIDS